MLCGFQWGFKMIGNEHVYSASDNSFYPLELRNEYIKKNCWPVDGVPVTNDIVIEFIGIAPAGKVRGTGADGLPAWVDIPPRSHEQYVSDAERTKAQRLSYAQRRISLWQTQLQLGMISDADKTKLIEWMNYITALQAVDTSTAPDINWPQQPAE